LLKLDPATKKVTEYPVPQGQHPYGMTIGADKNLWYVGHYDNKLVKVDPQTGDMTGYKVGTPWYDLRRITTDAQGNLWVGAHEVNKLVEFNPKTQKFSEFTPPSPDSGPFAADADKKRNFIWINENYADKLARFDPRTRTFVEFPLPSPDVDSRRVRVDPTNPNRVWWDGRNGSIGYVEVLTGTD
jgi:virginiamycin B lyase